MRVGVKYPGCLDVTEAAKRGCPVKAVRGCSMGSEICDRFLQVVFGLKLVEAPSPEQQPDGDNKEGQPKPSVQESVRQLSFWVASVPQQSGAARPEA